MEWISLAIGKSGQNARLAAKLTNWKIDIKSETQFREMLAKMQEENNETNSEDDLEERMETEEQAEVPEVESSKDSEE